MGDDTSPAQRVPLELYLYPGYAAVTSEGARIIPTQLLSGNAANASAISGLRWPKGFVTWGSVYIQYRVLVRGTGTEGQETETENGVITVRARTVT